MLLIYCKLILINRYKIKKLIILFSSSKFKDVVLFWTESGIVLFWMRSIILFWTDDIILFWTDDVILF